MTPTEHVDPDAAQAQVFRDLLNEEIAALTARIESTPRYTGAEDSEGIRLRGQRGEACQLLARLTARYPELDGPGPARG